MKPRSINLIRGPGKSLIVHHDGHPIYGHLGRADTPYADVISVDCWAHVQRLFTDEIKAEKAPHAQEIVDLIGEPYAVDATTSGRPPPVRRVIRRRESVPTLECIKMRLGQLKPQYLEKGDIGQAIRYVEKRWAGLPYSSMMAASS